MFKHHRQLPPPPFTAGAPAINTGNLVGVLALAMVTGVPSNRRSFGCCGGSLNTLSLEFQKNPTN